ncbi:MAG: sigma 54-interacting transcriptional regulator [Polyangiaceae bacterium]|nr:sigma 54-interacting transcriptional regulator [Polyangiaceae bacterium]
MAAGGTTRHLLPDSGRVSLGRAEGNDIRIDDSSVSRRHAVIHIGPGPTLRIEDLGSANGTKLRRDNNASGTVRLVDPAFEIAAPAEFAIGDAISLGSATIVVRRVNEAPAATGRASSSSYIVRDEAMKRLYAVIDRVAEGSISVLLLGETGVGKEVLAETIHRKSPRAGKPFLRLNCGALSESLLESELFGHEKGSFTSAIRSKPGLFETAEKGTVFLDEIGELPLGIQVKLLRVIEERQVMRVGGLSPRPIDVRFISATNRDLATEVQRGTFRQDLYFRLNGIALSIPPLRERRDEIEPLARAFAVSAAASIGRSPPVITAQAMLALLHHDWPGNVRELRNAIERAVVLSDGVIRPEDFVLDTHGDAARQPAAFGTVPAMPAVTYRPVDVVEETSPPPVRDNVQTQPVGNLREELGSLERQRMIDALEKCAGNQTAAAALLGIPRRTFVSKLSAYNIPRPRKKG